MNENSIWKNLCDEFEVKLPDEIRNRAIYQEIANFQDAEYVYCIAYEMLIRTDEFISLMKEYDTFIKESSEEIIGEEFTELNKLIGRMNALGLKKTSFLGFDSDDDHDNVFKKIKQYNEICDSQWSVRMLHKFDLNPSLGYASVFHMLIDFYFMKEELYVLRSDTNVFVKIPTGFITGTIKELSLNKLDELNSILYIPCSADKSIEYKSLNDDIYLKELDKDFLEKLKENKNKESHIKVRSEMADMNVEYWHKYSINELYDGLEALIGFYTEANSIYYKNGDLVEVSNLYALKIIRENLSDFYIPCVNRADLSTEQFINVIKKDGHDVIYNKTRIQENDPMLLVRIDKYLPLYIIENKFLSTLKYENMKNRYTETEPLFSRPRLMFDEARLVNIPINLNLSKEDILIYISQIKDNYDRDKRIVKTDKEYFFNLTLESDKLSLPKYIKQQGSKPATKQLLPSKRKNFKKSLADAFYIYDMYKFFLPLYKMKREKLKEKLGLEIQKIKDKAKKDGSVENENQKHIIKEDVNYEIKKYTIDALIEQITGSVESLSEEQVKYYLKAMKEFIHGSEKGEDRSPKYKNLIIGNSYILKSNINDLIDILGLK